MRRDVIPTIIIAVVCALAYFYIVHLIKQYYIISSTVIQMRKAKKKFPKEVLDVIPYGYYCYMFDPKYRCPFWYKIKNLPEQECGYCALLGKSDYEMNREIHDLIMTRFINGKRKRTLIHCGPDNPSFMSLLWDKCKECNLKIEEKQQTNLAQRCAEANRCIACIF